MKRSNCFPLPKKFANATTKNAKNKHMTHCVAATRSQTCLETEKGLGDTNGHGSRFTSRALRIGPSGGSSPSSSADAALSSAKETNALASTSPPWSRLVPTAASVNATRSSCISSLSTSPPSPVCFPTPPLTRCPFFPFSVPRQWSPCSAESSAGTHRPRGKKAPTNSVQDIVATSA